MNAAARSALLAALLLITAAVAVLVLAAAESRTSSHAAPTPCPDTIACHALKRKTTTDDGRPTTTVK